MGRRDPFDSRRHGPDEHFRLCFYGAVLLLREIVPDTAATLPAYLDELRGTPLDGQPARAARLGWDRRLATWEDASPVRLPFVELRAAAGLDRLAGTLLFLTGLPEEDTRFGRPSVGLLSGCWPDAAERVQARRAVSMLVGAGLAHVVGTDAALHPDPGVWDVLRGEVPAGYLPPAELPELGRLILPEPTRRRAAAAVASLRSGGCGHVVVRGPEASGRRTLLRALARELGHGVLELTAGPDQPAAGAIASLLGALPVVFLDPVPGETAHIPRLAAYTGPLGVRMPTSGGLDSVDGQDGAVTLYLGIPDVEARVRHWAEALDGHRSADLLALAEAHRMTGGTIRRVARLAVAEVTADGRTTVTPADVTVAGRSVRPEPLGALAARVPVGGGWDYLVVNAATRDELLLLERRCRRRERLPAMLPGALGDGTGPGVRALFTGPSGTGKTLSARLLAAALGKDLYRLDLSSVVNKYLGETEKNLDRVLSRAETLDVVLLIDEGDVLLAQRTDVGNANDRYANLETSYLLARLESFEGILVITTNAERHIDRAFERRLDVVVEFPAPGPAERAALWRLHLPAGHAVGDGVVGEIAARCALTGGQVRNAVLHACLLAIDDGDAVNAAHAVCEAHAVFEAHAAVGADAVGEAHASAGVNVVTDARVVAEAHAVTDEHVVAAVRREYRKIGALCPLRIRPRSDLPINADANGWAGHAATSDTAGTRLGRG